MDNLSSVISKIRRRHAKKVLLHFPAGYGPKALEIAKEIEKAAEVVIWAPPCYGACDIPFYAAKILGIRLIVSFGHSGIRYKYKIPVIFVEPRVEAELENLPMVPGKKIGLISTIQYIHLLDKAKKIIRSQKKRPFIGKHGPLSTYDGQITGCEFRAAKSIEKDVDAFLLLAEGDFHPKGLANAVDKPLYAFEPITETFEKVGKTSDKKINFLHEKNVFGIMVSIKPGQINLKAAEAIVAGLEKAGKQAVIFAADTFTPDLLNYSAVEVLITTACPRVRDDYEMFGKPVLTAAEVLKELPNLKKK